MQQSIADSDAIETDSETYFMLSSKLPKNLNPRDARNKLPLGWYVDIIFSCDLNKWFRALLQTTTHAHGQNHHEHSSACQFYGAHCKTGFCIKTLVFTKHNSTNRIVSPEGLQLFCIIHFVLNMRHEKTTSAMIYTKFSSI